MQSKATSP